MQPSTERRHDRTDPNGSQERFQARYDRYCADFAQGRISIHVFRAHMHGLGFSGAELENEINLHYPR